MPEFVMARQVLKPEDIFWQKNKSVEELKKQYCSQAFAYTLYCSDQHPQGTAIEHVLSNLPLHERQQLACAYDTLGQGTPAIASFYDRHLAGLDLQNTAGLVGAGATVSENRLTGFQKALREYQAALIKLRTPLKNRNFFVRARKHRPENRGLRAVNEDSRTELTPLSRKKCIF